MKKPSRWSTTIAVLILGLMVGGIVYSVTVASDTDDGPLLGLAFASYGVVGALIVAKRPSNRVGWLFAAIGVVAMATGWAEAAVPGVVADVTAGRQPSPLAMAMLIYDNGFWYPFFGMFFVVVPLIYPTGHALSKRWAWVGWVGMAALLAVGGLGVLQPTLEGQFSSFSNPIGVRGMPHPENSELGNGLLTLGVIAGVFAMVSVVWRYRRAHRVERLQLKWLMFSVILLILWTILGEVVWVDLLGHSDPLGGVGFSLILMAVPLSAGVAILRYRLYEIDRIVSRTVTYAVVAGLLAVVYAGGVFALTRVVPATGDLAVAGSTLAVAALFNPVRRRVHIAVDRRFNRTRVDADQLVEVFAGRLRAESDLGGITAGLEDVVARSFQPSLATVWVRGPTYVPDSRAGVPG
ncbi:MAG: hypothetical protein ACT4OP_07240 [Actinomycetota bacterium]